MRDIRFRAWDKKEKKMHYTSRRAHFSDIYLKFEGGLRLVEGWMDKPTNKEVTIEDLKGEDAERVELMQYTGLKDSKGVEIYEGDIVKCSWGEIGENEIVEYKKYGFIPFATVSDADNFEYVASDYEVIGNIYENPELLKENK